MIVAYLGVSYVIISVYVRMYTFHYHEEIRGSLVIIYYGIIVALPIRLQAGYSSLETIP